MVPFSLLGDRALKMSLVLDYLLLPPYLRYILLRNLSGFFFKVCRLRWSRISNPLLPGLFLFRRSHGGSLVEIGLGHSNTLLLPNSISFSLRKVNRSGLRIQAVIIILFLIQPSEQVIFFIRVLFPVRIMIVLLLNWKRLKSRRL